MVSCYDTKIQVIFSKHALSSRLYFGDVQKNKNFSSIGWERQTNLKCNFKFEDIIGDEVTMEADFPNGCGLTEHYKDDHIYYNQTIELTFGEDTGIITRQSTDQFHVLCMRNRTVQQSINTNSFDVDKKVIGQKQKSNFFFYILRMWDR